MEPPETIIFFNYPVTYGEFFTENNLFNEEYNDCLFVLTGKGGKTVKLYISYRNNRYILYIPTTSGEVDVSSNTIQTKEENVIRGRDNSIRSGTEQKNDIIAELKIIKPDKIIEYDNADGRGYKKKGWEMTYMKETTGGRKASVKKEICGRLRCIYKIQGSRKEHIKYKGCLITVADYKKLMKKA